MNLGILTGQLGGKTVSDGVVDGNFGCAQAIGEVTIIDINQPDFSPPDGRKGDTIPDQGWIYGDILTIEFTGKLQLFHSGR